MENIDAYKNYISHHFESHSKTRDFKSHDQKIHSVAWSCDGRRLASGSYDKRVGVYSWDRDRLVKEKTFTHGGSVDQLCWHPTVSDCLASASADKTVRIFDTRAYRQTHTINTKGENINICWSPDGNTIVAGNKDDVLSFIDTRKWSIRAEEPFKYEVNEIAFNKECDLLFMTTGNSTVNVMSTEERKVINQLKGHTASCICIDVDPSGKHFAVGSADALISIWDIEELSCLRMLSRLEWPIRTLSFSHDGMLLAAGSEDLVIDIALVETGERIAMVHCDSPTLTLAWHPKRMLLAYACDEKEKDIGTVKLFGLPNQ